MSSFWMNLYNSLKASLDMLKMISIRTMKVIGPPVALGKKAPRISLSFARITSTRNESQAARMISRLHTSRSHSGSLTLVLIQQITVSERFFPGYLDWSADPDSQQIDSEFLDLHPILHYFQPMENVGRNCLGVIHAETRKN